MGISYLLKELWEWLKTILLAFVIALTVNVFIQPTIVRGESMYPTLVDKDLLIVLKTAYLSSSPKRGDIIIFKSSLGDELYIKRVIGEPGDKVTIKEGKVYVNNQLLNEEYVSYDFTEGNLEVQVPKNKVFVLGDNRLPKASLDSRSSSLGLVSVESILGKTIFRLYPLKRIGQI